MKISALDLSPIPSGHSATEALANTIDLAKHAEAIGLERYWLAEHHNAGSLACPAPEIMIAAVAAATSTIRVGSGGVMLPNHSPLKVAETFRVLSALHPGRIDLGVGRAAGTDPKTALLLRQARELLGADAFPAQLDELLAFLVYEPDLGERFGPVKAVPIHVPPPPVFLLGSSKDSAAHAARLGLGFAFAHHIGGEVDHVAAMKDYREHFRASRFQSEPYAILAVSVMCAKDERAAEDFVRAADIGFLRFGQGIRDLPMPSASEARAYPFDEEEEVFRAASARRHIAGTASPVADRLRQLHEETRADEIMVMTAIHDHDERKRSYDRVLHAVT